MQTSFGNAVVGVFDHDRGVSVEAIESIVSCQGQEGHCLFLPLLPAPFWQPASSVATVLTQSRYLDRVS